MCQHRTLDDRLGAARVFVQRYEFPIPLYCDDMSNSCEAAFCAWPERLAIVENGVVQAVSDPFTGFWPEFARTWLETRFSSGHATTVEVE